MDDQRSILDHPFLQDIVSLAPIAVLICIYIAWQGWRIEYPKEIDLIPIEGNILYIEKTEAIVDTSVGPQKVTFPCLNTFGLQAKSITPGSVLKGKGIKSKNTYQLWSLEVDNQSIISYQTNVESKQEKKRYFYTIAGICSLISFLLLLGFFRKKRMEKQWDRKAEEFSSLFDTFSKKEISEKEKFAILERLINYDDEWVQDVLLAITSNNTYSEQMYRKAGEELGKLLVKTQNEEYEDILSYVQPTAKVVALNVINLNRPEKRDDNTGSAGASPANGAN